jgi:hypothetical protein
MMLLCIRNPSLSSGGGQTTEEQCSKKPSGQFRDAIRLKHYSSRTEQDQVPILPDSPILMLQEHLKVVLPTPRRYSPTRE